MFGDEIVRSTGRSCIP